MTLIFVCFSITCKKDNGKITINGRLYDPYIKKYLSDARVTISSSKITSGFYNSNYIDIATAITDGNGNFSFEFEREKSAGYRFYITKDKYFDNTIDVADADVVPGTPYAPQFNLFPEAFLKLHVKNNEPWNSSDFIVYSYATKMPACMGCCTNTSYKGHGTIYDSLIECKTYGSNDVIINWHVTKMGTAVVYGDTVFCTPFDTTFYEILY